MEKVKVYHVWWEKIAFDQINTLCEQKHRGLYQLYADHPVYGRDTLVYIGQTKDQTFAQRMSQHNDFTDTHLKNYSFYYGVLYNNEDVSKENIKPVIDEIETLLIKAHYPAYNANEIKGLVYNESYFNTIILNWNDYGLLLPEVSGLRFSFKYWDGWNEKMKIIE